MELYYQYTQKQATSFNNFYFKKNAVINVLLDFTLSCSYVFVCRVSFVYFPLFLRCICNWPYSCCPSTLINNYIIITRKIIIIISADAKYATISTLPLESTQRPIQNKMAYHYSGVNVPTAWCLVSTHPTQHQGLLLCHSMKDICGLS